MSTKTCTQVQELKEKGNEAVKQGNFTEAILHYTYAIKLDPTQYQLHSNRSFAFLKLQQFYHALEDANETIRLKSDWAKGYFRKGEVEFSAEQYDDALISYRKALRCDPENAALLEAIRKTARMIGRTRRAEMQTPWIGAGLGFIVGVLIVAGDFALAKSPVLTHPILKVLVIIVLVGVGYGIARLYRYYIRIQRNSLLDPPIDLLGESKDDDENKDANNEENKKPDDKRRSKAAARQRYKKGKS